MKNSMHLDNPKHPFQFSKTAGKSVAQFAKTVGVGSNPGGDGDKISANAAMKKKRPMQGPGDAR